MPEFPIGNVIVKTIRPALVVMHGAVLHYICKFVEVSGRVNIGSKAAADSLIDFRPARTNASNHIINRG